MGTQPSTRRSESVCVDWRTPLSSAKGHTYELTKHNLETYYGMFSVNLDEAFGMRRAGRVDKAFLVLAVAPALCDRFTCALLQQLRAMYQHARHFGTAPNMASLDPENFQNSKSQRVARFNGILSRVLLTRRSQFLQKLSALAELVEDLDVIFDENAQELGEEVCVNSEHCWKLLDSSHFDLTTCLWETEVLLKCFLLALPEAQITDFQATLLAEVRPAVGSLSNPLRNLARRRLTAIKGQ